MYFPYISAYIIVHSVTFKVYLFQIQASKDNAGRMLTMASMTKHLKPDHTSTVYVKLYKLCALWCLVNIALYRVLRSCHVHMLNFMCPVIMMEHHSYLRKRYLKD